MNSQTIDEMAKRLAVLEGSLALARTEICSLRNSARQTKRARGVVVCLSAAIIAAGASFGRWSVAYADGQTVTAPFTVVSQRTGKKVLQVRDDEDANWMTFYDQQERAVGSFTHSDAGGIMALAGTENSEPRVVMGVENHSGALILYDNDHQRVADILVSEIGGRGIGVYDKAGQDRLLMFVAKESYPELLLRKDSAHRSVMLLGGDESSLVRVYDSASNPIVTLGQETHQEDQAGGGPPTDVKVKGMVVYGDGGKPIAKVYQNQAGNGSVMATASNDQKLNAILGVGDSGPALALEKGGILQAAFALVDGIPALDMKTDKGIPIVEITQGANGGGKLQIGDPAGNAMVEAGVLASGCGLVRTFPTGNPGAFLVGMPGTFIKGREKQGEQ